MGYQQPETSYISAWLGPHNYWAIEAFFNHGVVYTSNVDLGRCYTVCHSTVYTDKTVLHSLCYVIVMHV